MKKLLSITLALILALSLCVPAFAEVYVDGESKGTGEITHEGNAHVVYADAANDNLAVNGDVTGDVNKVQNSVSASYGAEITVNGTVSGEISWPGDTVNAAYDSTKVTVGNVEDNGKGNAITATFGATVTVNDDVIEKDDGNAIFVSGSDTKVSVGGDVIEEDDGNAINATKGAAVKVEGIVTESGRGDAINASEGATVIVIGTVTESGEGHAIKAAEDTTVKVGGNVTGADESSAIYIFDSTALVIVEGLVTGNINNIDAGTIYLGQLAGDITGSKDKIHFLIGTAAEGSAALSAVTLESDIVAAGTIDGVNENGYKYTTTADTTALNGKTIILKPEDGKILTVSGFDGANVTYVANEDGTVTFTIGDSFTGGMQNLVLVLTDKPASDSEPVYYIVSLGSVTVVEFTAPDGVAEGLIKALESADHAGITVDSSLVGDGSVKVLKDGEELSAKNFSIYTHADGSIDIILSNTYLFALGSGSYDFTAVVGGLEIPFTVAVEK